MTKLLLSGRLGIEYQVALTNAAIFLLAALAVHLSGAEQLPVVLAPNAVFLFGSLATFLLMARNGHSLAPVTWYVMGSGVFFGFGVIAGGLHASEWTAIHYGNDTRHLVLVNLLNSCSVVLVLATAVAIAHSATPRSGEPGTDLQENGGQHALLLRIYPYLIGACGAIVLLKYIFFPLAENLVLRSLLDKAYFFLPSVFLLFGMLLKRMSFGVLTLSAIAILLEVANGLLSLNKYQILSPLVAYMIGLWAAGRSYRFLLTTTLMLAGVFWIINPMVSIGRLHHSYDPRENTVVERYQILADYFNVTVTGKQKTLNPPGTVRDHINMSSRLSNPERVRAVGVRFDVASIEGYLINEYNSGRPGKSLVDVWAVLVPRFLWPGKPIITRFANELNAQYFNDPSQASSAIAPTYAGEAYWNHGPIGVAAISVFIGCCFGWLSRCSSQAQRGNDTAYFFVAYPALASAAFVESWIVATYIGGFAIIVLSYVAMKFVFSILQRRQPDASTCSHCRSSTEK